jgi:hypothetical protein
MSTHLIGGRPTFYKLGVYAMTVKCLTPGDLHRVEGTTDGEAIGRDRGAEVSRWHSRLILRVAEGRNR